MKLLNFQRRDGRVGLRRQIKVLVRKGVGSNPTLVKTCYFFRIVIDFVCIHPTSTNWLHSAHHSDIDRTHCTLLYLNVSRFGCNLVFCVGFKLISSFSTTHRIVLSSMIVYLSFVQAHTEFFHHSSYIGDVRILCWGICALSSMIVYISFVHLWMRSIAN